MLALRTKLVSSRVASQALRAYSTSADGSSGSTGSFRGDASGDSFTKRERASEDWYVKEHEKDNLKKLRAEIEKREKDLADLKDRASKLSN